MTWPAEGMSTPTLPAMSGSTPIVTNSVVPMTKPPRARATRATTVRTVLRPGRSVDREDSLTPPAKSVRRGRIPGCDRSPAPGEPAQLSSLVAGLGQVGVAQQKLRTAAPQHRVAQLRAQPLPCPGDAGCARAGQHRAWIALERRANGTAGEQPAYLVQVRLDPAEQPVRARSDEVRAH